VFLERVLIPLHKTKYLPLFHPQLSYCVIQFLDKDPSLTESVIKGLLKLWPIVNSAKEVLFLTEIEEMLEGMPQEEFSKIYTFLIQQIAKSLNSPHFQVAEKALFLLNNTVILSLVSEKLEKILPVLYGPLNVNTKHWNKNIQVLTFSCIRSFRELNDQWYEECAKIYLQQQQREQAVVQKRTQTWEKVERQAMKNKTYLYELKQKDEKQDIVGDAPDNNPDKNLLASTKLRRKSLLPQDPETVNALKRHKSLEDFDKKQVHSSESDDDDDSNRIKGNATISTIAASPTTAATTTTTASQSLTTKSATTNTVSPKDKKQQKK